MYPNVVVDRLSAGGVNLRLLSRMRRTLHFACLDVSQTVDHYTEGKQSGKNRWDL